MDINLIFILGAVSLANSIRSVDAVRRVNRALNRVDGILSGLDVKSIGSLHAPRAKNRIRAVGAASLALYTTLLGEMFPPVSENFRELSTSELFIPMKMFAYASTLFGGFGRFCSNRFVGLVDRVGHGSACAGLPHDILLDHPAGRAELCAVCHTHPAAS